MPVVCSDNVPGEALVTDLVQKVKVRSGVDNWAESILNCQVNADRLSANDQVQMSGFEVVDVAKRIEKTYLGFRN